MADSLFNPSGLFDLLKQANLIPTWNQQLPYHEATGTYNAGINNIVAPKQTTPTDKNVLAHEMAHATEYNLFEPLADNIADKLANGDKITNQELQFYNAYKAILGRQVGSMAVHSTQEQDKNIRSLQGMLPKKWDYNDKYNQYRSNGRESLSFGVGNSSVPQGNEQESITHMDPTRATEMSILMEMYKNMPKELKTKAIEDRKKSIEYSKTTPKQKEFRQMYNQNIVDIFADPFAPTIK